MKSFIQFVTESISIQPNTKLGSNPGGIHVDAMGNKHYVKKYANHDQAKVEALAGKIYGHMGIKTVEPQHLGNGVVSTKWNPDIKPMKTRDFGKIDHEQASQVGRMHAAAVVTKNWDIVGTGVDHGEGNIMRHQKTGELHAIDHGGAFHFRARGGPKDFGPDIGENHSLRNSDNESGHVFSTVFKQHPHAEKAGIDALHHMDMGAVHKDFSESGLSNWKELHHNFQHRRQSLLDLHGN